MHDTVPSRELRNDTAGVLRRVASGQTLLITQGQHPVAVLSPVSRRRHWVEARHAWARVSGTQADAALAAELAVALDDRVADL